MVVVKAFLLKREVGYHCFPKNGAFVFGYEQFKQFSR